MNDQSSENRTVVIAQRIARSVFGGVSEKSAQWELCLETAREIQESINNGETVSITFDGMFDAADKSTKDFASCREFNKKYPVGTEGVVEVWGGNLVKTKVAMAAMVFPNPRTGQTVMAWFEDIGWKNVSQFQQRPPSQSIAEELTVLALQAKNAGKKEMADLILQSALVADPTCFHALNERGALCTSNQEFDKALEFYSAAAESNPRSGEVLNNKAMALRALGRSHEAVEAARKAMKLSPGQDMVALNAASALDDVGEIDECLAILDEYIERNPNNINIHYNKSLILLSAGRFYEGWREYAWRLRQPAVNSHYDHFDIMPWSGGSIDGQNVLVWGEQGLGDEILTATMINDLAARAAHVTLLCTDRLVPLFQRSFPNITVDARPTVGVVETFPRERLAPELIPVSMRGKTFHAQMSQSDLGQMLRPNIGSFPFQLSFLKSASSTTFALSQSLRKDTLTSKIIGISWHSKRNIRIGTLKSLSLRDLAPILKTPGCTFVNLQYGDCDDEIAEVEKEFGVKIFQLPAADPLTDMDSFASLVAAMDLVISASNTTVHIAGGLGVPTWVMTPTGPGKLWYWHRSRTDSPWYPSVELFRQPNAGKWGPVVETIAERLAEFVK